MSPALALPAPVAAAPLPALLAGTDPVNAFSVDVEEYFHVALFEQAVRRRDWDRLPARAATSTRRLLELCERAGVRGTFFVLGWIAERCPELVLEIQAAGHELATHGQDHRRVMTLTPAQFREDVRRAKGTLEDIAGTAVIGYRAPSYSIVRRTLWAMDVLAEQGFRYDSSIFPIRHDHYGIPEFPRFPAPLCGSNGTTLYEFPISTVRLLGVNVPFVGGGYLRQLPLCFIRWGMRRVNRVDRRPVIVYVHPWEIDPGQPRQAVGPLTRLRHYRNLASCAGRLETLFREFRFTTVREVLGL